MPSVVTKDADEATQTLEDLGFVVKLGEPLEVAWNDPLNGVVAQQTPAAGATAEFGATITIRIGQAATEDEAPNVLGDNETTARTKIENAGFIFAKGPDISLGISDPNNGKAMEQAPPPNTVIAIGSTMTIRFGKSATPAIVPDLVSNPSCMTEANATAAITAAGLVSSKGANVSLPFGDPCNGKVVDQSPDPLTAVAPGSTVTYQLGVADPGVTLTSGTVLGKTLATVQGTYPTLTWVANAPTAQCHDPAGDGTKIGAINPTVGSTVASNATITYWIAANNAALTLCTAPPTLGS